MNLPVAENWFKAQKLDDDTSVIIEPHIHVSRPICSW